MEKFPQGELLRKYEDIVRAQARKRQATYYGNQYKSGLREKLPEVLNTGKRATEELGEMAGVSRKTYEHATAILDKAPEEVIQAVSLQYSRMYRISGRVLNGLIPVQKTALNRNARFSASPNRACISSWAALW